MKSTDYRVKYVLNVCEYLQKIWWASMQQIAAVFNDTGNRWTFVYESAGKNSVNAVISAVGMLLSLCVL